VFKAVKRLNFSTKFSFDNGLRRFDPGCRPNKVSGIIRPLHNSLRIDCVAQRKVEGRAAFGSSLSNAMLEANPSFMSQAPYDDANGAYHYCNISNVEDAGSKATKPNV